MDTITAFNIWQERNYLREVQDAVENGEPFTAYVHEPANRAGLSGWARFSGWTLQSWLGTHLGHVVSVKPHSRVFGKVTMYSVTFCIGGRTYYGRTQGEGMYVSLRLKKTSR